MKRIVTLFVVVLLLLLTVNVLPFNVANAEITWSEPEIADSTHAVGQSCFLALNSNNDPCIVYLDLYNGKYNFVYKAADSWSTPINVGTSQPGASLTGPSLCSLAFDSNDRAHISYIDLTSHDLVYHLYSGLIGKTRTVDSTGNVGASPSIALDSNEYIHISYFDGTNGDLKYAFSYDGDSWQNAIVDSTGIVGGFTSLALDSNDSPHIGYYDYTNHALKYAHLYGIDWAISTVDSTGDVGNPLSLALDSNDNPHISYYDYTNGDLKYAYWDGTWTITTLDSTDDVGWGCSLALDSNDNPHISYYYIQDVDHRGLKYAYWDGSSWVKTTLDSPSNVTSFSSLALDSNDNPHISYYDYTNGLKYITGHSEVVPDFTAWLFIPFLMSATLLGLILRKRLKKPNHLV